MLNFLYKITKPHKKLKVNVADILLLIEPVVMKTPYFLLGRLFLIVSMFLNYFGLCFCKERFTDQEQLTIKSTIVIIALLLIYLLVTGA